jgi:enterochelin esterase-like enzyme
VNGLAIQRLIDDAPVTTEKVDAFFEAHDAFPIVEGPSVTFLFRGPVDGVNVRHWIYGLESSQPMTRVEGTDLFYTVVELPPRSRVEYKLEIWRGGHGRWIEDPLNPNRAQDPFGANSVAHGEGYAVPSWTLEDPEARKGRLELFSLYSDHLGGERSGALYFPARYRTTRRYPLVVVHDGTDFLKFAGMKVVLDNLIHQLTIPDMVVCLVDSPDRLKEYAADGAHGRFLTDELVPHLEAELPLEGRPQSRCLVGASFGAVASLATAYRHPGVWGRLMLMSGSFAFTDIQGANRRGPLFDPVVSFVNELRRDIHPFSERLFVSCGVYESLIYENRSLVPILDRSGMEVRFVEARDGHNWENWRDRLREGLSWLFPGPVLMVYE